MDCCGNQADVLFPLYADIFYPMITQGVYNEIKKEWVFDRTITCYAAGIGGVSQNREEIKPAVFLQYENHLVARSKSDLRITSKESKEATTNILITNIRSSNGDLIYIETAGPRSGRGTIYEIATIEPFLGPFNNIEYYKMLWRRAENQAVDD